MTARRERCIQRRIQDARFPVLKTLDAFSFEAQPDLDRDAIQTFDCRLVAEVANVVFVGGVGTGEDPSVHRLGDGLLPARLPVVVRDRGRPWSRCSSQRSRRAGWLASSPRTPASTSCTSMSWACRARQSRRRPAVRVIGQRYERRSLVVTTNLRFVLSSEMRRPNRGRRGHRPDRPPRDGAADRGAAQGQRRSVAAKQNQAPASRRKRPSTMPTRAVGPISTIVCSPASKTLRPRFAGLTALPPGCALGPGRSSPTAQGHSARRSRNLMY